MLSVEERSGRIIFDDHDLQDLHFPHDDPIVLTVDIANYVVQKVLVDSGSSTDIIFLHVLHRMELNIATIALIHTPLMGFGGSEVTPLHAIDFLRLWGLNRAAEL